MTVGLPLGGDAGDEALVDDTGTSLTYGQLGQKVDRRAEELAPHAGGLAFLAATPTTGAVVDLLACLRAGVAVLLLGPGADTDLAGLAAAYQPDLGLGVVVPARAATALAPAGPTALLLPTSGSTGSPKYARISLPALVASARGIADVLGTGPGERGLASLPLHYSYGLSVLVSHLVGGGTTVLTGHSAIRPEHWDVVRDQRVTSLAGVPYSYQLYDRVGVLDLPLPHLRSMTQAGGRLEVDTVRRYHAGLAAAGRRFYVMYGQTEATSRLSVLDPDDLPEHAGSVGRPVPGGRFHIDDLGGGVGEVIYTGPNVMLGYAHERADLAQPDELAGTLATGDVGRLDDDGRLWLTGRLKRIVKLYGERVSLDDIEQLARPWGPAVAAETGPDRLTVFVEGVVPDGAARGLERRLGVPPRTIEVVGVDQLPRTASGKVDYARLVHG